MGFKKEYLQHKYHTWELIKQKFQRISNFQQLGMRLSSLNLEVGYQSTGQTTAS